MQYEKFDFIELRDIESSEREPGRLFIRFEASDVILNIVTNNHNVECTSYRYLSCMQELLNKMGEKYQILIYKRINAKEDNGIYELVETYSIGLFHNQVSLHIKLEFIKMGVNYSHEVWGTSYISSLAKLRDIANVNIDNCVFCKFAQTKSYGDEDTRYGWYCFRELETNLNQHWSMYEEDFEKAISNLEAFHWCPKFIKR